MMNERIKELAEQAFIITTDGKIGHANNYMVEKFAELIVQECLDVVAMRIYLGPEEICRQECKALASEIKEHFGVEE
jgi:hypothetical protein